MTPVSVDDETQQHVYDTDVPANTYCPPDSDTSSQGEDVVITADLGMSGALKGTCSKLKAIFTLHGAVALVLGILIGRYVIPAPDLDVEAQIASDRKDLADARAQNTQLNLDLDGARSQLSDGEKSVKQLSESKRLELEEMKVSLTEYEEQLAGYKKRETTAQSNQRRDEGTYKKALDEKKRLLEQKDREIRRQKEWVKHARDGYVSGKGKFKMGDPVIVLKSGREDRILARRMAEFDIHTSSENATPLYQLVNAVKSGDNQWYPESELESPDS